MFSEKNDDFFSPRSRGFDGARRRRKLIESLEFDFFAAAADQGCQMVHFKPKNHNLGKF
jgi:hypothetical protein